MNTEKIIAKIKTEDKSGLAYILCHLRHDVYHFLSAIEMKKSELLERVLRNEDKFFKLKGFRTYEEFFK